MADESKRELQEVMDTFMKQWADRLGLKANVSGTLDQWELALKDQSKWETARIELLAMILSIRAKYREQIMGRCGAFSPIQKHATPLKTSVTLEESRATVIEFTGEPITSQKRVLVLIKSQLHEEITSVVLAERLGLTVKKASQILTNMVTRGLLEKRKLEKAEKWRPRCFYKAVAS